MPRGEYKPSEQLPEFFLSTDKQSPWFEERKLFLMQLRILCKVDRVKIEREMEADFFRMPPELMDELHDAVELILEDRTTWEVWCRQRRDQKRMFEQQKPDRKSEAAK